MHDIFISYASADLPRVIPLVRALEQRGWQVWWDRTLLPGDTYDEVIDQAIEAAKCVIVVWPEAAVASEWVRAEAEEGRQRNILLPVMIEEARIPLRFRQMHTARLMDWPGTGPHQEFEALVRAVSNLVPPSPPVTPLTPEDDTDDVNLSPPSSTPQVTTPGIDNKTNQSKTTASASGRTKRMRLWNTVLVLGVLGFLVYLAVQGRDADPKTKPRPMLMAILAPAKVTTYRLTIHPTPPDSTIILLNSSIV